MYHWQVFELGLTNRWEGFMSGTTEIRLSVPIYNEVSSLPLIGDSDPVLLSVGGMYVCTYVVYCLLT